jgi:hypothetical protein
VVEVERGGADLHLGASPCELLDGTPVGDDAAAIQQSGVGDREGA